MTRDQGPLAIALLGALCLGSGESSLPTFGDVALEYRGLAGCPGEATFRERIADVFALHDPFVAPGKPASHRIRVELSRKAGRFRGDFAVLLDDGTVRGSSFEVGDNCDALVWQLSRRLGMVIDLPPPAEDVISNEEFRRRLEKLEENAEAQREKSRAQDEKVRAQGERVEVLSRQNAELKSALEEERRRKMNLTYTLSTGVLMTANLTSTVGPGVWLGGDLRFEPVSMGLELRAVLPARFEVGPYDTDLSQLVGLLTPCGRYSIFFGCAVAGAGIQINHDSNFSPRTPPTLFSPLVQIGGRIGVEVPLGESRFAIRGWGEVLFSTPRTEAYYIDSENERTSEFRPDVSAFFGVGLVVKLGQEGAK